MGEELLEIDRLFQIVIRSGLDGLDDALHVVAGGEHNDRDLVAGLAQPLDQLQSRHAGQAQVDHSQGVIDLAGLEQAFFTVADKFRVVAALGEALGKLVGHADVVFDDQKTHRAYPR